MGNDAFMTDNFMKPIVTACRSVLVGVAVMSLFMNLLLLTAPIYMMQVFDRVLSSRSTETLLLMTGIALVALATLGALEMVRSMTFIRMGGWLDRQLGTVVFSRGIEASAAQVEAPSVQGLRDIATLRGFLTGSAIFPILDAPWAPIFLLFIYLMHPWLGMLALGGAILLFVLALTNELASRELLQQSEVASMKALRRAENAVRNADAIEAMGMLPNVVRRWRQDNGESLGFQMRASVRGGAITAISKFLRLSLQVGVMGLGAYLVIQNELGPGSMIAASILMARALSPVEMAISGWRSAVSARQAYARIRQITGAPTRHRGGMSLPKPSGTISVENLAFAYPGAEKPALRGITFALDAGETLGLIGPTASGKTTLSSLLVGNLAPRVGHVRLDGHDISQWDPNDRGQHVGFVPQDVELFGGTVRENIARMQEGDPEAVIAAARLAGVHDMILQLAAGYDTEIGEGGAVLSGGQKQRIALARAVYGNPSFVVLDEPNANLDNDGEAALLATIAALKSQGTTAIIVSHRPSLLRDVDKVLILQNGTVRMFGPPEEVIPAVTRPSGTTGEVHQ